MMRWSDRQQALLQGMGLRLWLPAGEPEAAVVEAEAPAVPPAHVAQAGGVAPVRGPAPMVAAAPAVAEPVAAEARRPFSGRPAPATRPDSAPAGVVAASAADTSAVASMDWALLAHTVAGCQACGLCSTRRNTVFGVGHASAHCMVVGEAPGENEDRQGEPFVGAAGQLLDRMLATLGLSRGERGADGQLVPAGPEAAAQQVYIANTLKCRPPGNRNPSAQELAQCVPYLQRQVALVRPKVILAMGRFAVQALLGSDAPLGRLRGQVHRWQGVPLVVTYHPAYLLRQPADKARAWADLCLAAQLLDEPAGPH